MQHTAQINLRDGEQPGEDYRQINPRCTMPALRTEEGTAQMDSAAIAAYREACYPQAPMMGRTSQDMTQIASWQWRVEFEGLWRWPTRFATATPPWWTAPCQALWTPRKFPSWASAVRPGPSSYSRRSTSKLLDAISLPQISSASQTSRQLWQWTLRE